MTIFNSDRLPSNTLKFVVLIILSVWVIDELLYEDQSAETTNQIRKPATNEKDYLAPPSYEVMGRGLVYNCKGKHWACVNRDAYFACRDNMRWNPTHHKPHECYLVNVYATEEDCRLIQIHNINFGEKTDFCENN